MKLTSKVSQFNGALFFVFLEGEGEGGAVGILFRVSCR